jgi:hypothetical protein
MHRLIRVPTILAVLGLSTLSLGCSECEDPYPVGTRLRVTVPEAFAGCHVTFDAGATYDLVAGPTTEDYRGCEYNVAKGPPVFTSTELVFGTCGGDVNSLGIACRAELPGCVESELDYSDMRIFYHGLPKEPGETVRSLLKLQFTSASECRQSCDVDIPVTIRW